MQSRWVLRADPDRDARAGSAVQAQVPDLLTRWSAECPAVRLALAGLAVAFPTDRTLPALTPRLRTLGSGAVADIRGGDHHAHKQPERVDYDVPLAAVDELAAVEPTAVGSTTASALTD